MSQPSQVEIDKALNILSQARNYHIELNQSLDVLHTFEQNRSATVYYITIHFGKEYKYNLPSFLYEAILNLVDKECRKKIAEITEHAVAGTTKSN